MKEHGTEQEFIIALTIYGGIILACILVAVALALVGIAIKSKLNKGKLIRELYEKKGKEHNGRAGARGKF